MIISASRRTDIPAFYSDWLMHRLREGFAHIPQSGRMHQVDLQPGAVDALVFWTRNGAPLLPHLPELDKRGYAYYFQYTLTGYSRALEPSVPQLGRAIDTFKQLSAHVGPGRMVWRYDPILFSASLTQTYHLQQFEMIAQQLAGTASRVVISFADLYAHTVQNLRESTGELYVDMAKVPKTCLSFSAKLAELAHRYGFEIQACAESLDLTSVGIQPTKCVDDKLLAKEFGRKVTEAKDYAQREACGCVKSIDIGAYNTCLHGCAYCYATRDHALAKTQFKQHDPASASLVRNEASAQSPVRVIKVSRRDSTQQASLF